MHLVSIATISILKQFALYVFDGVTDMGDLVFRLLSKSVDYKVNSF